MKEYESLGKVDFELKWSENSERLPSHSIIEELRSRSRNQNDELAAAARRDFPGESFAKNFSYRKNGKSTLLTNAHSIAKRYTRLRETIDAARADILT